MDMFFHDDEDEMTVSEEQNYVRRQSLTYEDLVKDLILEETQYMRDLNMIIKVFRSHFARLFAGSKVSLMFCQVFSFSPHYNLSHV